MLLGASLGAIMISKVKQAQASEHFQLITTLSLTFFAPFYLTLALANRIAPMSLHFLSVIVLYFLGGLSMGLFSVLTSSKLMEEVESGYLGRISGVANAIGLAMVPLSSLLCAALCAQTDVSGTYMIIAGLCIAYLFVIFIMQRKTAPASSQ